MTLNPNRLFIATTASVGIIWLLCVAIVALLPSMSMSATGAMMHMDTHEMSWQLTASGVVAGLVIWSVSAGILAWLIATLYNAFS